MKCQIKFIVISVNLQTGEDYIVSLEEDKCNLPSEAYLGGNKAIEEAFNELYNNILELDLVWTNPQLLTVEHQNDTIIVYYSCMIPSDVVLKNGYYWIQCPKHNVIINKALNKHTYL